MILRILSNLLTGDTVTSFRRTVGKAQMFDKIVGYEGIKRTFLRSLNSPEPVHILRSWEQLPNPNIRYCLQIGRLVKNQPNIEMAIADEIQNFTEYGGYEQ